MTDHDHGPLYTKMLEERKKTDAELDKWLNYDWENVAQKPSFLSRMFSHPLNPMIPFVIGLGIGQILTFIFLGIF
jgi:hypothetical protein